MGRSALAILCLGLVACAVGRAPKTAFAPLTTAAQSSATTVGAPRPTASFAPPGHLTVALGQPATVRNVTMTARSLRFSLCGQDQTDLSAGDTYAVIDVTVAGGAAARTFDYGALAWTLSFDGGHSDEALTASDPTCVFAHAEPQMGPNVTVEVPLIFEVPGTAHDFVLEWASDLREETVDFDLRG